MFAQVRSHLLKRFETCNFCNSFTPKFFLFVTTGVYSSPKSCSNKCTHLFCTAIWFTAVVNKTTKISFGTGIYYLKTRAILINIHNLKTEEKLSCYIGGNTITLYTLQMPHERQLKDTCTVVPPT